MQVKIKKLTDNARLPERMHADDAGADLYATSCTMDENGAIVYGTGLAFEIPEGYVGLLFPRSSNAKKDLVLSNSVGVLDSCYRGEVTFKYKPLSKYKSPSTPLQIYKAGERIGQIIIIPYPSIEFVEANELSETERGDGGYGSTGA